MPEKYKKLIINTDGGARGNPGPAGIGIVITSPENVVVDEYREYIGETTNNQAEYQAVVKGLELAKTYKPEEVEVRLDSELVTNQINGEFKLKNPDFQTWFIKIHNYKKSFKKITFTHIRREQNTAADRLVNEAIDEAK
jgi:ribonuclease HI